MPQTVGHIPMTDDERGLLRTVVMHPGWKLALSLMDSYTEALEEGARRISRADPLGNAEQIARSWAYVHIAERLKARLIEGVEFELEVLRLHGQEQLKDPAEEAQARRDKWTLEAI